MLRRASSGPSSRAWPRAPDARAKDSRVRLEGLGPRGRGRWGFGPYVLGGANGDACGWVVVDWRARDLEDLVRAGDFRARGVWEAGTGSVWCSEREAATDADGGEARDERAPVAGGRRACCGGGGLRACRDGWITLRPRGGAYGCRCVGQVPCRDLPTAGIAREQVAQVTGGGRGRLRWRGWRGQRGRTTSLLVRAGPVNDRAERDRGRARWSAEGVGRAG